MGWSPRKKLAYGLYAVIAVAMVFLFWRVAQNKIKSEPQKQAVTPALPAPPQVNPVQVSIGEKLTPKVQKAYDAISQGQLVMIGATNQDLLNMSKADLLQIKKLVSAWPKENPAARNNLLMIYARNIREASDVAYFKELVMRPADANQGAATDAMSASPGLYALRTMQIMVQVARVSPETKKALKAALKGAVKSPNPEVAKFAAQIKLVGDQ